MSRHKSNGLRNLSDKTGRSESEIIRRALDEYDDTGGAELEDSAELTELVRELEAQNIKTRKALVAAEREMKETMNYFSALRAEREAPKSEQRKTKVAA